VKVGPAGVTVPSREAGQVRFALVDGAHTAHVPAGDRGLHYGDGLFETLAVRAGEPEFLDYHLERLARGCATLGFRAPDRRLLEREIADGASALRDGVLKLIVTRGSAGRGYRPPSEPAVLRILLGYDLPAHPPEWAAAGVRVRVCDTRLGRNRRLAGLKHLNRLEQVLARAEWDDPGVAEGLMLDDAGHVVCATSANVFVARGGELITPSIAESGVAGVMRRVLMEAAARARIAVAERTVSLAEVNDASELMLSNSLIGLWRVREVGGRELTADVTWRRLGDALAGVRRR
jgi:4-amino-4-deoxychorismate lyase